MIEIRSLSFRYDGAETDALRDVTLTIPDGAFLGIIGPAGAGKTTLAHSIGGIIPHAIRGDFYGAVEVDGHDTADTRLTDLSRLVGTVFQDVDSQIISSVVEDEILYGLENFGVPREEVEERMAFALNEVGIAPLRHRSIASLSGGQRQKVAIASLVALRPKILVLDEPTGELDPRSSRQIFTLLKSLNREYGMTVVVVEQKIMLLCEFAERLAVLSEGRIVREGSVREVLGDIAGLREIGVNCPRSALFSSLLAEKTGREIPVCVNADEAVDTAGGSSDDPRGTRQLQLQRERTDRQRSFVPYRKGRVRRRSRGKRGGEDDHRQAHRRAFEAHLRHHDRERARHREIEGQRTGEARRLPLSESRPADLSEHRAG